MVGEDHAIGTWLTDTLPVQVDFGRWVEQPHNATVSGDQITWKGTVTAGAAITLSFVVDHVGSDADVVINVAEYGHSSERGQADAAFTVEGCLVTFLPLVSKEFAP